MTLTACAPSQPSVARTRQADLHARRCARAWGEVERPGDSGGDQHGGRDPRHPGKGSAEMTPPRWVGFSYLPTTPPSGGGKQLELVDGPPPEPRPYDARGVRGGDGGKVVVCRGKRL